MTETASHIAIRYFGSSLYEKVGPLKISVDKNSCLKFKGVLTNNQWLQTQDTIELIDENTFKWLGRQDFVINSGGFKIHPKKIESELKKQQTDQSLMITYLPDEVLGQKVVLLLEDGCLNSILIHCTIMKSQKKY